MLRGAASLKIILSSVIVALFIVVIISVEISSISFAIDQAESSNINPFINSGDDNCLPVNNLVLTTIFTSNTSLNLTRNLIRRVSITSSSGGI